VGLLATNSQAAAKSAGLRYVTDRMPGIRRIGTNKAFRYISPNGRIVRDPAILARIRSLAVPPAWTEVWICSIEEGHLQAVGRDIRKRKQYRYHPRWREVRDCTKFDRMADFAKVLPEIRRRIKLDLSKPGLTREKVLATIVRLLHTTLIRIGNEEYTKQNNSFGLTTLRDRHVNITGATVHFYFRGKSGIKHSISVEDPHLAKIVRKLRDLPGYELFQYIDETGERRSIGSADVNEYLREITSDDFTAKDFRTWAATILAFEALCEWGTSETKKQTKRNINQAVEKVAERLGNTVAVCKKCYIHPAVFEAYETGRLSVVPRPASAVRVSHWEKQFVRLLAQWSRPKKSKPGLALEQALRQSVTAIRKKRRLHA
jgi:DNA topoisomerase-1